MNKDNSLESMKVVAIAVSVIAISGIVASTINSGIWEDKHDGLSNTTTITDTVTEIVGEDPTGNNDTYVVRTSDPSSVASAFINNLSTIADTPLDAKDVNGWVSALSFAFLVEINDFSTNGSIDKQGLAKRFDKTIKQSDDNFFIKHIQPFEHSTYGDLTEAERTLYQVMAGNSKVGLVSYDMKLTSLDKSQFIHNDDGSIIIPFEALKYEDNIEDDKTGVEPELRVIPDIRLVKDNLGNYKVDARYFVDESIKRIGEYVTLVDEATDEVTYQTDA